MTDNLFPQNAIALMQQAHWDSAATRSYEMMSGGFKWSDEWPAGVSFLCMEEDSYAFRFVLGYRASLIQGRPRDDLRAPWDQLSRECPEWPGFRPERCSPTLKSELETASNQSMLELDKLDEEINGRMAEGKHAQ